MLEIFESFVKFDVPGSTNQGGMGLGLTLAKGIVDLHKGRINVSSAIGEGSTFQVVIPK
jgi:signal transduction histidine kinase